MRAHFWNLGAGGIGARCSACAAVAVWSEDAEGVREGPPPPDLVREGEPGETCEGCECDLSDPEDRAGAPDEYDPLIDE